MRVALLTQNARAGDAVGRQVAAKAAALLDRGADVCVVLADVAGLHPDLKSIAIKANGEPNGPGYAALVDAELIVVEYPHYYPLLDLLPILADGKRRILFEYLGVTPPEHGRGHLRETLLRGREARGMAGFADTVVVNSRFTRDELAESVDHDDVCVLGCAFDDVWFCPGEPTKSLVERLGVTGPILLFVGRLAPNKRLPIAIRALPQLPSHHLTIVGPSGDCYEAERLACRELAADLGLANRVHFVGCVDDATLRDFYRSADALVIPSIHEGFGIPAIEAMACGLPVIATRAAALPETVGHAGLTFADDGELVHHIVRLAATRRLCGAERTRPNRIAVVSPTTLGGAERSLALIAECTGATLFDKVASVPEDIDAVIVGPFAADSTRDAIHRFGRRAILVPCLHDEPAALTERTRLLFDSVGGLLFHSATERDLAARMGLSHPNQSVIGTVIDCDAPADANHGQHLVGVDRYLVYCGRFVAEKNLPLLFDYARQLEADQPGQVKVAFVGEGGLAIPQEPWAINLGRLSEQDKRDVIAGAAALVNLSVNESLSLVVLEAMALGTPVIVNADSEVMAEHGVISVANAAEFSVRATEIREPEAPARRGESASLAFRAHGEYVRREFGSRTEFAKRVDCVVDNLNMPLVDQLRAAGFARAAEFGQANWRAKFDRVVEQTLEQPSRFAAADVSIDAIETEIDGANWTLQLRHHSGVPIVPTGPGRTEIIVRVRDADGAVVGDSWTVALREVIAKGDEVRISVPVRRPRRTGEFHLEAGLRIHRFADVTDTWFGPMAAVMVEATVVPESTATPRRLRRHLDLARSLQDLPDGYVDVSTGRLGRAKRWLKEKLLHNFRVAYVDVLAKQQSRFNRRVIDGIGELAANTPISDADLRAELAAAREKYDELAHRVARLERDAITPERQEAA